MATQTLPIVLVTSLNELGFAMVEAEIPYTFIRLGPAGVFRLSIVPIQREWRVELAAQGPTEIGRLPAPSLPDGLSLLLSTAQLVKELPRLLESSLPAWDIVANNNG
jgi:hypothetical protein